jgi:periplasmic protein CpxP/Spy
LGNKNILTKFTGENQMRSIRTLKTACAIAALAFVLGAIPTWAQQGQEGGSMSHGGRMMASPEERTDKLTKALNLNDDQKSKVLSAYQDEQKQMESLRSDTSTPRDQKRSKMMQIHENTVSQIKGVLNADQAKKFDAMQQEMKEHYGHQRG